MEIYITNTQEYDFGKTESYSERSTKMDALKISELEFDIKYADGTDKHVNEGILIEFNKEKITGHFGTDKLKHLFDAIGALEEMVQAIGKADLYRKYRGFPEEELTGTELAAIATMLRELESYKETGLTPDQIREMDKLYTEKCKELAAERAKNRWISCNERFPDADNYVLVSFENCSSPDIGRYEEDDSGGAFYPGNDEESYASHGLFVNAWMPVPESYQDDRNLDDVTVNTGTPSDKRHGCFGAANNDCRFCGDDGK